MDIRVWRKFNEQYGVQQNRNSGTDDRDRGRGCWKFVFEITSLGHRWEIDIYHDKYYGHQIGYVINLIRIILVIKGLLIFL